jgi:CubicO group peptidase (beta-lactamase class C family)
VSGVPRAEFLAKSIFTPLGMSDTFIGSTGEWPRERMASGYYLPSQGYEGPPIDLAGVADLTIASAAGDIISSLPDLTRWANALLTPDNPIGLSLADFTPDCAGDGGLSGPWFFPRRYARGVEAWSWGGRTVWGHRGSFFGYHSGAFVDPVSRATVSMFFSMLTAGSFLRFLDVQAPDYMGFLQACMTMAVDAVELP